MSTYKTKINVNVKAKGDTEAGPDQGRTSVSNKNISTKSLSSFLNERRVVGKDYVFTHTSLSGGSYYISGDDIDEFMALYIEAIKQGRSLHLSEKHRSISPIVIDFDFRQDNDQRRYTKEIIDTIIKILLKVIEDYIDTKTVQCVVLEKPVRKVKEVYKDGLHLMFPNIVTIPAFQYFLRKETLKDIEYVLRDCNYLNDIKDIYDEAVIDRNNWLMYGSNKPDEKYKWDISHIYIHSFEDGETLEIEYEEDPDVYVPLLSIINKHDESKIKKEYEEDNDDVVSNNSNVTNVTETTNIDTIYVKALVSILSEARADKYDSWIRVGWALHNIDHSPSNLDVWIEFSKLSSKYRHGECDKLWWKMREDGLGMGSLCKWAKEDNPEAFHMIQQKNIYALIDKSLSGTHTDIAKAIHSMFREFYICGSIKAMAWYEFKHHRWFPIENAYTLRQHISNKFADTYLERAKYYKNKILLSQHMKKEIVDDMKGKVKKLTNQAEKLKMVSFKDALLKETSEYFYDPDFMEKLDTKINLICFTNGVYDLEQHVFRAGEATDYITMTTDYEYTSEVLYDIREDILTFVRSIMKNEGMKEYMLKVLAYMLSGNKYLEQLWFFTGKGRNGKGTICNLLKNALGKYHYEPSIAIVTTTTKNSSGPTPDVVKAKGKRVLVAGEPDDEDKDSKFRVNKLKQLRGNDLIQARGLYKDCLEFKPQFGMIFQMNEKPELSKVDDAIGKSLKIIEFPYQFVNEPVYEYQKTIDTTIKAKFEDNMNYRQQFMLILLEYHKTYIHGNQHIADPMEVQEATKEYLEENNPLMGWLSQTFDFTNSNDDRVKVDDLYNELPNKPQGFNKKKLGHFMGLLGFKSKSNNSTRYYDGLKRKSQSYLIDDLEG
jgi:P4 family phage/plasmid primase-like protien